MIIAVGDLVWDMLVQPDGILQPGGDTTGRIELAPGGSAANVAVWVARAGASAGFIGSVGRDALGDLIVADLAAEGVVAHVSRTAERGTGVILALIAADGQRSMITNQGADFCLRPIDLPQAVLQQCRHVHLTAWSLFSDPPRSAAIAAAQLARTAGASLSFDPASFQMIEQLGRDEFDTLTGDLSFDIVFPNRDEARVLSGSDDPATMALRLHEQYRGAVVALKLDADGCIVVADGHLRYTPADPVARAVDSTGAGDAFNGVFLASYLADGDLERAARRANRAGAWVVARDGARPAIDRAHEQF